MNKTPFVTVHLALAASLLLAACGGQPATTAPGGNTGGGATAVPPTATPVPPTPTPVGPTLGEVTRLEAAGLSFQAIPGYIVESEDDGFVTMEAPDASNDTGPSIVLLGGANRNGVNIDEAFGLFTGAFDDIDLLSEENFTLNGNRALRYDFEGASEGQGVRGRFIAAATPDNSQVLVLLGIASPERWEEIDAYINLVAESVAFFAPVLNVAEVRQWAALARVNNGNGVDFSQSAEDFTAGKALGEPLPPEACGAGDWAEGWQADMNTGEQTLTLEFERPVNATTINIYPRSNPESIAVVRIINQYGEFIQVYSDDGAVEKPDCEVITIDVGGYPEATGVEIVVDTNRFGLAASIDAVELVGEVEPPQALEGDVIEQWASAASSSFVFDEGQGALGPADVWRCDLPLSRGLRAWEPWSTTDNVVSLMVTFEIPVMPDVLTVYEVTGASTIIKIELVSVDGILTEIYTGTPDESATNCPGGVTVDVPNDFTAQVTSAIITIDQGQFQFNARPRIDAVRLIGQP